LRSASNDRLKAIARRPQACGCDMSQVDELAQLRKARYDQGGIGVLVSERI